MLTQFLGNEDIGYPIPLIKYQTWHWRVRDREMFFFAFAGLLLQNKNIYQNWKRPTMCVPRKGGAGCADGFAARITNISLKP